MTTRTKVGAHQAAPAAVGKWTPACAGVDLNFDAGFGDRDTQQRRHRQIDFVLMAPM
jgi:hypothetical protein